VDAVIIGGGVIGLSVAWRAARAGLSVAVVDPDPGSGASHYAAGMIAPISEAEFGEDAVVEVNRHSAARYPAYVADVEADSGRQAGYRQCGTLHVAVDADEHAALERAYQHRKAIGLPVVRLSAHETRELEPGLAPSIRSGMLADSDHVVDPRALTTALLAACTNCGVEIRRGRGEVSIERGRVSGVRVEGGEPIGASQVVLAAGCWAATVGGVPSEDAPPVRPVKGQILRLRGAPGMITRTVRGSHVYILPRGDGRVVIGGTIEERGFDTTVFAGAVLELLRDARALVPDVAELELLEASAGLRPGSPDNAPIVGDANTPGLIVATGHYRNGFLLAPATADAVVDALSGHGWPEATRPWWPSRFRTTAGVPA
jgi:glycine oxidase